ncbi:hypothetical protein PENANT_c029G05705 [Penicillium antarcticum]|uniref:Alpha and gamma adaptin binding protein p34 n=1 Tax=Penicillium antarcticum TaxID=416450 RepID=A0A1V6PW23_9EURO|nr:uncharacterized protein N7508_001664 [Penicillium antarcticum]KAJ5317156.1 hypothetical protein N7508_001664 [Penicillium antarcticum]OQD81165.1 hypothetical protein PENANT_c029G05705 [Penicillium antarcticum]
MAFSTQINPATSAKSNPKVKTISNPRRLLILSPTSQSISIIPPLLTSLTGTPIENPPQQDTKPTVPDNASPNTETPPTTTTFAGYTTHAPLSLSTKYYTAEVPLWVDEIPLPAPQTSESEPETQTPTAEQWKTEFLSPEADIVRDAVGALAVCAHIPSESNTPPTSNPDTDGQADPDKDPAKHPDVVALLTLMRNVGAVKGRIDEERGGVGDVPGIFVLVGKKGGISQSGTASGNRDADADADELALGVEEDDLGGEDATPFSVGWWEDQFYDLGLLGWEVVQWDPKGDGEEGKEGEMRNVYGERVGMPRIKEVLETHDWSASGSGGLGLDGEQDPDMDSDDDLEDQLLGMSSGQTRGFGNEVHELEREMFGLRMAIERGGGDGFGDEEEEGEDNGDDELDVESMEALMMRMQAIKDMSNELPEDQRKRFAAKAVQDIMREL